MTIIRVDVIKKKGKTKILVSGLYDAALIIKHKVKISIWNKDEIFVRNLNFLIPKICCSFNVLAAIWNFNTEFSSFKISR